MYMVKFDEIVKKFLLNKKKTAPNGSIIQKAQHPNDIKIDLLELATFKENEPEVPTVFYQVV